MDESDPQGDVDMSQSSGDYTTTTGDAISESDEESPKIPELPLPEFLPADYQYPVTIPACTSQISHASYPPNCRLPPELLSRCFLFLTDRASQAVSLRICKWLYWNAQPASNLYNIVHAKADGGSYALTGWTTGLVKTPASEDSAAARLALTPAPAPRFLNTKLDLLRHTTCLVIAEHIAKNWHDGLRCPASEHLLHRIPMPNLRTVTFRCNGLGNFCSANTHCCGLIRELRPQKLVFRDMCGPIPSLPRYRGPSHALPEGIEEVVLVLDPKRGFNIWGDDHTTFDHPPSTLAKVTIVFNTQPGEEWTAHKRSSQLDSQQAEDQDGPAAEWLDYIVDEVAVIAVSGPWEISIINASSVLHTEVGIVQQDPVKVDKAIKDKIKQRVEDRVVMRSLMERREKGQAVFARINFASMEDFLAGGEAWVGVLELQEVKQWWRVLDGYPPEPANKDPGDETGSGKSFEEELQFSSVFGVDLADETPPSSSDGGTSNSHEASDELSPVVVPQQGPIDIPLPPTAVLDLHGPPFPSGSSESSDSTGESRPTSPRAPPILFGSGPNMNSGFLARV